MSYSPESSRTRQPISMAASTTATSITINTSGEDKGSKPKKPTKRRKVNHACLYCRRSHMTCDDGRPCQRCIKREIGHLCHDEQRPKAPDKQTNASTSTVDKPRTFAPVTVYQPPPQQPTPSAWPINVTQGPFLYQPETLGNEFSVLSDFLETLDESSFFTNPSSSTLPLSTSLFGYSTSHTVSNPPVTSNVPSELNNNDPSSPSALEHNEIKEVLPLATKTEKFLLTAADQESGSRNERLDRVISSKYEAGLLKPYNYVKGYARLSRWMDRNVSQESKQQILQPLSVLRPKFRAVAQSLQDIDLVFIEEAFERLLLDYDRVFSAMGVPACLWRRTGEIYKANREFTELVGLQGHLMRDGRLCIYELMAEESAVNYWEKYGHVAFDSSQKAVLTSCVLRYKPNLSTLTERPSTPTLSRYYTNPKPPTPTMISGGTGSGTSESTAADAKMAEEKQEQTEEGFINCCFSFTIRRDKWGIPTMIVGNFIQC